MKQPINLKQYKKWLEKEYGKPCKRYGFGCYLCIVWRNYEDLKQIINL